MHEVCVLRQRNESKIKEKEPDDDYDEEEADGTIMISRFSNGSSFFILMFLLLQKNISAVGSYM